MPKIVDHDARRAEIVAAVWRVIERSGMDGATVRSVAAEAGVSPGSLRYYFSDQGELVLFAAEAMTQRVVHRLEAHPTDGDGLVRAIRVLEEMLPLDEDRRAEASASSSAPIADPIILQSTSILLRLFCTLLLMVELISSHVASRMLSIVLAPPAMSGMYSEGSSKACLLWMREERF